MDEDNHDPENTVLHTTTSEVTPFERFLENIVSLHGVIFWRVHQADNDEKIDVVVINDLELKTGKIN